MSLKPEQPETIQQQLATASSAAGQKTLDPQLGRLLAQYFTLFVGIDV